MHKYSNQYYQKLLAKWVNNNETSDSEHELLKDDNIIGDIVRNLFVEDQMFPGGVYGFTEDELGKEDIYGQIMSDPSSNMVLFSTVRNPLERYLL